MKIVGLIGGSGSGKSSVAEEFRRRLFPVFDADKEYHSLISKGGPCVRELVGAFGSSILNQEGGINTKALASMVFLSDDVKESRLDTLNRITFPYMRELVYRWLERCRKDKESLVVLDAPTLIESGLHGECHATVFVTASKQIRLERIQARDHIQCEAALKRLNAQKSDEFYSSYAQYIIHNDGDVSFLTDQVERICKDILSTGEAYEL